MRQRAVPGDHPSDEPAALDRRRFLAAAGAALVGTAVGQAGEADARSAPRNCRSTRTGRRPNIVFILCDDLGWGELGCYGQQIIKTPHLDRMAREGVRFTDFYAAAPICAPSRCSALTGLHQGHARVRFNELQPVQAGLLPEDVTFGQIASAAGYATGLFGKWGYGPDDRSPSAGPAGAPNEGHPSHPVQKGFQEFAGFVAHHHATHGYWADYWWLGNKRVDVPQNAGGTDDPTGTPLLPVRGRYMPDDYVGRAMGFMERNRHKPFLLWLSLQLPHTPNEVPDWSQYDHLPYPTDTRKHAAMVTRADTYVGMLRAKVEQLGLADDTLFVFTSDNGPHDETAAYGGTDPVPHFGVTSAADVDIYDSNGPFRGVKQNIYEGGIRVPMVAWGPGVLPRAMRGRTVSQPFASYDLLPTIADLVGVNAPTDIDGLSMAPLLTGKGRQRSHPFLYWERINTGAPTAGNNRAEPGRFTNYVQAVRRGRWKLIRWAPGTSRDGTVVPMVQVPEDQWVKELYDLSSDPGETTDLAAEQPAVVAELLRIMKREHVEPPFKRTAWTCQPAAGRVGQRG